MQGLAIKKKKCVRTNKSQRFSKKWTKRYSETILVSINFQKKIFDFSTVRPLASTSASNLEKNNRYTIASSKPSLSCPTSNMPLRQETHCLSPPVLHGSVSQETFLSLLFAFPQLRPTDCSTSLRAKTF